MSEGRSSSELLGGIVGLHQGWDLRVLCLRCVAWRTIELHRLSAGVQAMRLVDVVARLRCSEPACKEMPAAVRAVFWPRQSWRKTPLYQVELLRRTLDRGALPEDIGAGRPAPS